VLKNLNGSVELKSSIGHWELALSQAATAYSHTGSEYHPEQHETSPVRKPP
jgi:hypothetical protein